MDSNGSGNGQPRALKRQFVVGSIWTIVVNISKMCASLVSLPILARILEPEDFGLVQMGLPVVFFLATIGELGLGPALVRDTAPARALWISAIWLNLVLGLMLSLLMYSTSPLLAEFYQEPRALPLLQALAVLPFICCAGILPSARMQRDMRFRDLALTELGTALLSTFVVVWCAVRGAGVMALVYQQLTYYLLRTAAFWVLARPPIGLLFDWPIIRPLLPFSLNVLGAQIVNFMARQADNVLIGRLLGAAALGFYSVAYRIMLIPVQVFAWSLGGIVLSTLSRIRDDKARYRDTCVALFQAISLITFPLMAGLAAVSEPFVRLLLGPKMAPVAGVLAILAPIGAIQSVGSIAGPMFMVLGRSDILFQWTIGTSVVILASLVIGSLWGLQGMAWAYLIANFSLFIPGMAIYARLIELSVGAMLAIFARTGVLAAAMAFAVYLLQGYLEAAQVTPIAQLSLCVPVGAAIYSALVAFANRKAAKDLFGIIDILLLMRHFRTRDLPASTV